MPLSSELTLASSPRAAADARRWVGDVCARLDRTDLVECAELGVSELVANAILHATAPYQGARARHRRATRASRWSTARPDPPVPPTPVEGDDLDLLLTFGRGLSMVAQCAVAWGATIEPDGKIVWFEPAPEMSDDGVAPSGSSTTTTAPDARADQRGRGRRPPPRHRRPALHLAQAAVPRAAPRAAPAVALAPVRLPARRRPDVDVRQLRAPVPRRLPRADQRGGDARAAPGRRRVPDGAARRARSS